MASIAAPVRDSSSTVIAALCLGGPTSRITEQWLVAHTGELAELAAEVSRALGYRAGISSTVVA